MVQKLKRLAGMSPAEVIHRARERFRRKADRMRYRSDAGFDDDPELDALIQRQSSSLKRYLRHGPARRFYPSVEEREGIAEFILQRRPEWLDAAIHGADLLRQHRVNLFAHREIDLGAEIDWHRDPVSGFQWPRRYWADYDLVARPPADAKIIHELNRQQHLPRLAKAYFLTGNEGYAREAVAQLESWIQQNPRWVGVNWHSSLEIAIRAISWLWTIFLLLPSEALSEEQLRRICRSLFAQLDHVYRYPSVYTSPNTHLIGEAAALFIAGALFQELPRARAWRDFGATILTREMDRQVCPSGVYGEPSSYYHCYAADFYLQVLTLARLNHEEFPETTWARFSRMLEFVMHLTRPDGSIPLLGDDDGGRALVIASENYLSFRDGLSTGAVLFGRPDFKYQSAGFSEETLWLLGEEAWTIFDSLEAQPPADLHAAFDDAGYFVLHSGWDHDSAHVVFDCGGFGIGSGGHAHSDALSFTMFSAGRDFVIDPGASVYNGAPEWRRFFRSTAAHNTVLVDEAGQAEPGATFRWKTRTSGRLLQKLSVPGVEYIEGAVDFPNGVTHRRRLVHVRPNYWIVLDDLSGKGEHDFNFLYHFAPGAYASILSDSGYGDLHCRIEIDRAALQLRMYGAEPIRAELICGRDHPIQGWASRVYGERRASRTLQASVRAAAPMGMMSLMSPAGSEIRSRRFNANTKHAIAALIHDGECDDLAIMAIEDGDLYFADYRMRGEFFLLRTENGSLRRLLAVNAYSFACDGETLFDERRRIPCVQAFCWDNGVVIERGDSLSIRERVSRKAG